jgi:hypothetical protein
MKHALLFLAAFCAAAFGETPDLDRIDRELEAHNRAQQTGICEVHHIRMARKTVDVLYGYVEYEGPYTKASVRFPNAQEYASGGCVIPAKREKASICVCPECKKAARAWAFKHPKDEMAQGILKGR